MNQDSESEKGKPKPEIEIEIVATHEVLAEMRERPAIGLRELGHPQVGGELDICIHERVLAEMAKHVASDTTRELGGLLVGNFCVEGKQEWVDVSDHIPALHTQAGGAHLKFTLETDAAMDKVLGERYPDGEKVSVGWYHSHPNLGVFFSGDDVNTHKMFQSPWQLAVVIDPVKGDIAFFRKIKDRMHREPGVAVYGEGDVQEPLPLSYDSGHREGAWDVDRDDPTPAADQLPGRKSNPHMPVTIDLGSNRLWGLGRLWIALILLALGALSFLIVALLSKPAPVLQGKPHAERLGEWVDRLFAAKALEPAKLYEWQAQLKPDSDPKKAEAKENAVESAIRTHVSNSLDAAERALDAWDKSFSPIGERSAEDGLKPAWESAWIKLSQVLPDFGNDKGIDTELIGQTLMRRYEELARKRGLIRIRVIGPDSEIPLNGFQVIVKGEVNGTVADHAVEVNDMHPSVINGRFEQAVPIPNDAVERRVLIKVAQGAESVTREIVYRVDRTPPTIFIDEPAKRSSAIEKSTITIIGRLIENDAATLFGPGDLVVPVDAHGYFRLDATLVEDEPREFEFHAKDRAGNESSHERVRITYIKPKPWLVPLNAAIAARNRHDIGEAAKQLAAAKKLDLPSNQEPAGLQDEIDQWSKAPVLVVLAPLDGDEIEGNEIDVSGSLTTGRDSDRLVIGGDDLGAATNGTFHARFKRKSIGKTEIDVSVRDGASIRAHEVRHVAFYDPSPGRVLFRSGDRDQAGATPEQRVLIGAVQAPVSIENPWGMKFRILRRAPLSEGKSKPASITYLQTTETTESQYEAIVRAYSKDGNPSRSPRVGVSKAELDSLMLMLNPPRRKSNVGEYRLPTSEEWDLAATLSIVPNFWFTHDGEVAAKDANFADSVSSSSLPELRQAVQDGKLRPFKADDRQTKLAPAASYPPNSMGFFDLLGNAWEWTSSQRTIPGSSPAMGFVVRGGSWKSGLDVAQANFLDVQPPDAKPDDIGFRLAVDVEIDALPTLPTAPPK